MDMIQAQTLAASADSRIGVVCRDGKPVFYINVGPTGKLLESHTIIPLVAKLAEEDRLSALRNAAVKFVSNVGRETAAKEAGWLTDQAGCVDRWSRSERRGFREMALAIRQVLG